MPGDGDPVKLRFPVPQCFRVALGQAKPSSPAAQRGQDYDGACTRRLPTSEPSPPPAKLEVGQMDGELAGVSAPHVLGPGQSP